MSKAPQKEERKAIRVVGGQILFCTVKEARRFVRSK